MGVWASPDPVAASDGNWSNYKLKYGPSRLGGVISGSGRSKEFHGANKDGGQYKSGFVAAMWTAHYKSSGGPPSTSSAPAGPSGLTAN